MNCSGQRERKKERKKERLEDVNYWIKVNKLQGVWKGTLVA
jgi:hypothetical protein